MSPSCSDDGFQWSLTYHGGHFCQWLVYIISTETDSAFSPSITHNPLCSVSLSSFNGLARHLQEDVDTLLFLLAPQFFSMLLLIEIKVDRPGQAVTWALDLQVDLVCPLTALTAILTFLWYLRNIKKSLISHQKSLMVTDGAAPAVFQGEAWVQGPTLNC